MPPGLNDTDSDTTRRMATIYAGMTPAEKVQRVRDLTVMANRLALAGLKKRHPDESESELLTRLTRQRLGEELFCLAYPSLR